MSSAYRERAADRRLWSSTRRRLRIALSVGPTPGEDQGFWRDRVLAKDKCRATATAPLGSTCNDGHSMTSYERTSVWRTRGSRGSGADVAAEELAPVCPEGPVGHKRYQQPRAMGRFKIEQARGLGHAQAHSWHLEVLCADPRA